MKPIVIDAVRLHVLWRETSNRVNHYEKLVRESTSVDECSNFLRWLQFSGVLDILKNNPQPKPLPVDGMELQLKVNDLIDACGEVFKKWGHKAPPPTYRKTDIDEIKEQLALLSARLPALSTPSPAIQVPVIES